VLPAAEAALAERLLGGSQVRAMPPFELTALGDDAGMIGAALLAIERAGGTGPATVAPATEPGQDPT
jgi:glucokinase